VQWDVRIPMRDGVHLSATAYRPITPKPAPAVFILTPYIAQSFHDRGVYFAQRGYSFLAVDVRGRGNSQGEFKCFANLAEDGYDVVEWLAQQPYCDGRVAMWGGSYQGYAQWMTASARPPHLKTIVPVASPWVGLDSPMRANLFVPYALQWLNLIAGRTLQDKPFGDLEFWSRQFKRAFDAGVAFAELDAFLGHPSPTLREWLAHPHEGAYWDARNPTDEQYSMISMPVLTITGIYDGDQLGALAHYQRHLKNHHEACHYLVIGPWNHAGTRTPATEFYGVKVGEASLIDLPKLHADWYAWTLQEGPTPAFLQKKVTYYVMGADRWRYADTLDAVTSYSQPFYLHSRGSASDVFASGVLAARPSATSKPDSYRYDPLDIESSELECAVGPWARTDQRLLHAATGKHLVYHSEPFEKDVEISGFFKLSAWIAIDQPDTDFRVSVHEVMLDGSALELTNDLMRARYRESPRAEKLIDTTEPLRYDFDRFMFTSRQIKAGSRLRLVVGPINSIYGQKNYNSGRVVATESRDDARVVTVRLFHDEAHPSALYVPFGQPL
jgi:putative CocE/NonD family hydrolase